MRDFLSASIAQVRVGQAEHEVLGTMFSRKIERFYDDVVLCDPGAGCECGDAALRPDRPSVPAALNRKTGEVDVLECRRPIAGPGLCGFKDALVGTA